MELIHPKNEFNFAPVGDCSFNKRLTCHSVTSQTIHKVLIDTFIPILPSFGWLSFSFLDLKRL